WDNTAPLYNDINSDQLTGDIDFGRLWISNDDSYLFIRIEVGGKINLQNDNAITLYIDTDDDSSTGTNINNIGAELEYIFGERRGIVKIDGNTFEISHSEISLITSPTVISTQFEIAIGLHSKLGENELIQNDKIAVMLIDNGSGKDQIPNIDDKIYYNIVEREFEALPTYTISKSNENFIRVLSYNVLRDNLFAPNLYSNYSNILKAIDPDIIGFQEVYDHSSQETVDLIEQILPSENGRKWYHSKAEDIIPTNPYNTDVIIVSRYKIKDSFNIQGFYIEGSVEDRANLAVLLDLRPRHNTDLLVINSHPPCCSRDEWRQEETDQIMAFIRDAKNGSGELILAPNTPIIIMGDMNFVGLDSQRRTLLTGDIFDNTSFGSDFQPDWNGKNLVDSRPYTTNLPMTFTWYNADEGYAPGRLDYIVYTSSSLDLRNSYSLFTPALQTDTLINHELEFLDAVEASDHLPLVADFRFSDITSTDDNVGINLENYEIELYQNYPNPFNPVTWIEYKLPSHQYSSSANISKKEPLVNLKVYDSIGKRVMTLVNKRLTPGKHQTVFNASDYSSGIYYYSLTYNNSRIVRKMVLLK
ncbi:MAG: endonuclease/exonuclease/phosphatase family protein, partial [Melioribacteraceae bacterium]|nr:endonuclease/exonuclease/phosphatase family protein [Melioribacteraceae bacterium]